MQVSPEEIADTCRRYISSIDAAITYCQNIAQAQAPISPAYAAAAALLREQLEKQP